MQASHNNSTVFGDNHTLLLLNFNDLTIDTFERSVAVINMTTDKGSFVRVETTENATVERDSTAEPNDSEGLSITLMPAVMLWLPHASISLLLLALVVASFLRFHCKYGHKYRKPTTASTATASTAPPPKAPISSNWRATPTRRLTAE